MGPGFRGNYADYLEAIQSEAERAEALIWHGPDTGGRADLQRPGSRRGRPCARDRPARLRDEEGLAEAMGEARPWARRSSRPIPTAISLTTRAPHPALLARVAASRRADRSLRAVQPSRGLQLGSERGPSVVASGDFHRGEHSRAGRLFSLARRPRRRRLVPALLAPAYITRLERTPARRLAAASPERQRRVPRETRSLS